MAGTNKMFDKLKSRARALKNEAFAVYLAAKDPRTPWYAKALIFFVVAHTFSPIDLIPDFIPILGYLDDLIITPDQYVSYAIIGVGGFLGLRKHDVAVPVSTLKDDKGKLVLPGASKDALKAMPKIEYAL